MLIVPEQYKAGKKNNKKTEVGKKKKRNGSSKGINIYDHSLDLLACSLFFVTEIAEVNGASINAALCSPFFRAPVPADAYELREALLLYHLYGNLAAG